jgi:hypothetical protein
MPYSTIRDQFGHLLLDAEDVLSKRSLAANEDIRDDLLDAAEALTDYAEKRQEDYGSRNYKKAERLKRQIRKLDPEDDDFTDAAAELRADLEYLADRCDFDLPETSDPRAPPAAAAEGPVVRDGVFGDERVVFDDVVTPDRLAEYALATSMYSPLPQSAYHRRKAMTPLLLSALLARALPRTAPDEDPKPVDPKPGPGQPGGPGVPPRDDTSHDDDDDDDHDDDDVVDDDHDADDDDIDDDDDTDDHDDDDSDDHDDDDSDDHDDDDDDTDDHDDDDDDDTDDHDDDDDDDDGNDDHANDDDHADDDHAGDDHADDDHVDDHDGAADDEPNDVVDHGDPKDDGGSPTPGKDDRAVAPYAPPTYGIPASQPYGTEGLGGEARLEALIAKLPGGTTTRPDLHGQLLAAGVRSPEALVALAAKDWPKNINEGVHLRRQIARILGPDHEKALPPASDLDSLVKAARREGRGPEQPLA